MIVDFCGLLIRFIITINLIQPPIIFEDFKTLRWKRIWWRTRSIFDLFRQFQLVCSIGTKVSRGFSRLIGGKLLMDRQNDRRNRQIIDIEKQIGKNGQNRHVNDQKQQESWREIEKQWECQSQSLTKEDDNHRRLTETQLRSLLPWRQRPKNFDHSSLFSFFIPPSLLTLPFQEKLPPNPFQSVPI